MVTPIFSILITSNSPTAVQCEPLLITWTGGTRMYPTFYAMYAQSHFLTPAPYFLVCHDILHLATTY